VIDGAPNPIFACDRERRLLLLNKAAAALYHADVDTAEGRDRREFIPHDAALENDAIDDRIFATGLPSLVKVHRLVDGTPHVFILAKYPLVDTQGHIFAVGGVITDITELRRAHQELQQANSRLELTVEQRTRDLVDAKDRAERADRTKTSFLSTITHELRAPLNAIIGFTDIMLQGLSGPINASQQRQLGIVRDSSQSLLELINELLDIARIEAGKVRLTYSTFDCRELLERTVRAFEPLSSRKNLSLECHVEPGVALVLSDAQRVGQIMTNVVSNAVKFTVTGGVTVTARLNGASVDIAVTDTGPGIALDDLPRIFMPFEQVGASHGRRDSTGLGLPIASQLARALGGDIRVASEPGRGSCFTVTLPLAAPQATATADR
jgi:PAS domain S-box-containing protein